MQPEFEVAWHGSSWRDDRPLGEPLPTPESTARKLERLPTDRPRPYAERGGRKPIIREEVERILRQSEIPLSALEIHGRLQNRHCTVAGVNSAIYQFKCDRKIVRAQRIMPGVGKFRCTYRWVAWDRSRELDAIELRAKNVVNGRLGGLKSGESRRKAAAS